jgi:hypothetical protein
MSVLRGIAGAVTVSSNISWTDLNVMLTDSEIDERWWNKRLRVKTSKQNQRHFWRKVIQT